MSPQSLLDATRNFARDCEGGDMNVKPTHPSTEHDRAARAVVDFFSGKVVDAAVPTCSCARGKASRDSCLDISILTTGGSFPQACHGTADTGDSMSLLRKPGCMKRNHYTIGICDNSPAIVKIHKIFG